MIDLNSATFVVGGVAGLGVGILVTGWWVTARTQSRVHAQLLESGERAQRADALATALQQRLDDHQAELGQVRQALAESQACTPIESPWTLPAGLFGLDIPASTRATAPSPAATASNTVSWVANSGSCGT